ncbi:MAG: flagellar assembly protein fliX [Hyphomicrobiales bacterium]|nr:flagellar assembly protein fliX [Hyphomicrobiales bacterium]
MRITTSSPANTATGSSRAVGAGGSERFRVIGDPPSQSASTQSLATIGLSSVLALQEERETPLERRKRQVRRGLSILDALDAIKRDLVLGQSGEASFSRLSEALALANPADLDTEARGLLRAVDVRAAVELAKARR